MTPKQVEAFDAVMRTGSVTGAAAMLHRSQPSISRLILQLEDRLGFALFTRVKGRMRPTAEAQLFHAEVARVFVGLGRLSDAAAAIRAQGAGVLRVAAMPALGFSLLPLAIRAFRDRFADCRVLFHIRSSAVVRDLVASGYYELGLAADEIDPAGLDCSLFAEAAGVCVMPRGHPLAGRAAIGPTALAGVEMVMLDPHDRAQRRINAAFAAAGVTPRVAAETQYALSVCNLVAAGVGVGVINPLSVDPVVLERVAVVPFRPAIEFRSLLLRPQHRPVSRLAEAFITLLATFRDARLGAGSDAGRPGISGEAG